MKNESYYLQDFDMFGEDKAANVKPETPGPRTGSTGNLLISFSPKFPPFLHLSDEVPMK